MSKPQTAFFAALLLSLAAPARADDPAYFQYLEESRATAKALVEEYGAFLAREAGKGPAAVIGVCKDVAPSVASWLSRTHGWKVSRVSLKPRNPLLGMPDAWEQRMLVELATRAARGDKPETLEVAEIVTEPQGRYFRFMRALPMRAVCLGCHGPAEGILDPVRSQLEQDYPHDPATGYRAGDVRGAVTIKRPL